jgi:hypothetical protein
VEGSIRLFRGIEDNLPNHVHGLETTFHIASLRTVPTVPMKVIDHGVPRDVVREGGAI